MLRGHLPHRGCQVGVGSGGAVDALLLGHRVRQHLGSQKGHQLSRRLLEGPVAGDGGPQGAHPPRDPVGQVAVVRQHRLEGFGLGGLDFQNCMFEHHLVILPGTTAPPLVRVAPTRL